jgi:hypothetical protein
MDRGVWPTKSSGEYTRRSRRYDSITALRFSEYQGRVERRFWLKSKLRRSLTKQGLERLRCKRPLIRTYSNDAKLQSDSHIVIVY